MDLARLKAQSGLVFDHDWEINAVTTRLDGIGYVENIADTERDQDLDGLSWCATRGWCGNG